MVFDALGICLRDALTLIGIDFVLKPPRNPGRSGFHDFPIFFCQEGG